LPQTNQHNTGKRKEGGGGSLASLVMTSQVERSTAQSRVVPSASSPVESDSTDNTDNKQQANGSLNMTASASVSASAIMRAVSSATATAQASGPRSGGGGENNVERCSHCQATKEAVRQEVRLHCRCKLHIPKYTVHVGILVHPTGM
jgi:hypothetical protein